MQFGTQHVHSALLHRLIKLSVFYSSQSAHLFLNHTMGSTQSLKSKQTRFNIIFLVLLFYFKKMYIIADLLMSKTQNQLQPRENL